ncbi:MAG: DoxX family protein [Pseudomonadota bacterium]
MTTQPALVADAVAWLQQALPWPVIARFCLVGMFPFSALDKALHWKDAVAQAGSSIVPAAFAPLLLVLGGALEIVAPVCIVAGWWAEPMAFLLAAYCAVTALLFHPFWASGDFWKQGASVGRAHFWDFTKNFGLVGGLLLVAIGRGF